MQQARPIRPFFPSHSNTQSRSFHGLNSLNIVIVAVSPLDRSEAIPDRPFVL
jgi:hypothetical protein